MRPKDDQISEITAGQRAFLVSPPGCPSRSKGIRVQGFCHGNAVGTPIRVACFGKSLGESLDDSKWCPVGDRTVRASRQDHTSVEQSSCRIRQCGAIWAKIVEHPLAKYGNEVWLGD